jgi:AcrR family transcriptional regulator
MERLKAAVNAAVDATPGDKPLLRLQALGTAYLQWALDNPTHFQVISSRSQIDIAASDLIRGANDEIRAVMVRLLEAARKDGSLAPGLDIGQIVLLLRALGYGLARMAVDGHFPEWHASEPPADAMPKALDLFMDLLRPRPASRKPVA